MRFAAEHALIRTINNCFPRDHAAATTLFRSDGIGSRVVFEDDVFRSVGVAVHRNSAMPNVVFYDADHHWLILIDAVTKGRSMDAKRVRQLRKIFVGVSDMLIFVSAFATRDTFACNITEIAWGTVAWMADDPAHLVHFGGNRILAAEVWERGLEQNVSIMLAFCWKSREQVNDRTGLTLLGLLDLTPEKSWAECATPLRGITELMTFFTNSYQKTYAPNTRETIRRFSMHQLVDAGVAALNPDQPTRPINSPNNRYQISDPALRLVRSFQSAEWSRALKQFLSDIGSLRVQYEAERDMHRLPVLMPDGQTLQLSPGGQNNLIKAILEEFCPRFTPAAHVIYVGDAGDKWAIFDIEALRLLGVTVDSHGKMPDVVVHDLVRNWLILIEAVTSHGPVDSKRVRDLRRLFVGASAGLVFVTAFESRAGFSRQVAAISWETEVWLADSPSHMVHFNGERFLGPY